MDAQIAVLDKNGREVVQYAYKARGQMQNNGTL